MFVTKKHLSRRTVLRGMGATVALPLLDAMIPARTALAHTAAAPTPKLGFIYFPHGAIMSKWTPAAEGKSFELPPLLEPLAPFKNQLTIVSGLENKHASGPTHAITPGTWLSGVTPAHQPRSLRRRHGRPDRGAAHRPGHAAAVARGRHRGSRRRRRLRPQLRLQLRRDDLVPHAVDAAADGVQSAQAVPAPVRPGRYARGARAARGAVREHSRRRRRQGRGAAEGRRARGPADARATISRACARSSGACRRWRRTTSRTSRCPMRRSAFRAASTSR